MFFVYLQFISEDILASNNTIDQQWPRLNWLKCKSKSFYEIKLKIRFLEIFKLHCEIKN